MENYYRGEIDKVDASDGKSFKYKTKNNSKNRKKGKKKILTKILFIDEKLHKTNVNFSLYSLIVTE